jgi:16S rRNA (guanine527-N7)-methyltransferase
VRSPRETLGTVGPRILGREFTSAELDQLIKYLELLVKWQRVQRLTSSRDPDWITRHLILDSLLFLRVLPPRITGGALLDFGSGAGIPGVPLAITLPETRVTLLESRQRRVSFLSEVIRELPLRNCRVEGQRAEAVDRSLEGVFDVAVIRCAGDPSKVVPLAMRFLADGGLVVVSGPPEGLPVAVGTWVEVEGVDPGTRRRFLSVRKERFP